MIYLLAITTGLLAYAAIVIAIKLIMRDRYQKAMHDHAETLKNMAEAYSRHAGSIAELDNSAIDRLKQN